MSKWVDITGISIPSDENDYYELIAFADAIAELDPIDMETIKAEAYNRGIDSERKRIADAWCKAEYERGYKDGRESAERKREWIPCSERLPENIRPVLVTWKNNDPASYYQYIVGKHFIGTAHYHRGKWYWYSSVTEDLLAEYGKCETEEFDEAIEAVAWMPLPKPYREREGE